MDRCQLRECYAFSVGLALFLAGVADILIGAQGVLLHRFWPWLGVAGIALGVVIMFRVLWVSAKRDSYRYGPQGGKEIPEHLTLMPGFVRAPMVKLRERIDQWMITP